MNKEELKNFYNQKKYSLKLEKGFKEKSFEDFYNWFNEDNFNKGCNYCGTTNDKSMQLFLLRPQATRGGKRGKRLELDRINPHESYDNLNNLVWCCYWCNNAKTNFFTDKEFRPIGKAIGDALSKIG